MLIHVYLMYYGINNFLTKVLFLKVILFIKNDSNYKLQYLQINSIPIYKYSKTRTIKVRVGINLVP